MSGSCRIKEVAVAVTIAAIRIFTRKRNNARYICRDLSLDAYLSPTGERF